MKTYKPTTTNTFFFFCFRAGFQPINGGRLIRFVRTDQVLFPNNNEYLIKLNSIITTRVKTDTIFIGNER